MESQFARQPWKWRSSLARKIFCLGKRRVTVLRTFLFHPGGTWKTFFFPFQSSKDPLHSSRSKKMKRDVRRGSFHHAWKNFVNSYPSIRLLQTATFEITVAPFPSPPPHLIDTLLKRDESGRGQGTVMGHYFCRGNWNFFPPFRNIAPERIVSSRAVIVSSSLPHLPSILSLLPHLSHPSTVFPRSCPDSPLPRLVAIVIVVVVISAHSSDSSCPLARETIYQNAGGRPLSQTIRNRYRSHYHFIAEILGRVMVPQRERERSWSLFPSCT